MTIRDVSLREFGVNITVKSKFSILTIEKIPMLHLILLLKTAIISRYFSTSLINEASDTVLL